MEDDKVASSLGTGWIKDLRDWVDIIFKTTLAVVGVVVGYYFSFEKQQNDDIQMIVSLATDTDKAKQAMSGPIAKAYFDQKRIPGDVYVAIYSYVNSGGGADLGTQQTTFNTLISASAKEDSGLKRAIESASASLPVLVFFKVRQKEDAARAEAIRGQLNAATLPNAQPISVPPVHLVLGGNSSKTILKCFRKRECETLGPTLVDVLKSYGLAISLDDESKAYQDAPTIRPNLFEVWLAKNFTA